MKRIRVVTYNIHHGRGTDGCLSLQRIAEILRESRADLIGLNEVDNRFSARSDYTDQISWLSEHLQMHHVFGAAVSQPSRHPSRHRQYGNGLLSRYPVDGWKNHLFPAESPFAEGRALLEADVRVHDRVVRLFVTHLSLSPWKRRRQIAWMLEKIRNVPSPVILTGDGNMSPARRDGKRSPVCSTMSAIRSARPAPHFRPSAPAFSSIIFSSAAIFGSRRRKFSPGIRWPPIIGRCWPNCNGIYK